MIHKDKFKEFDVVIKIVHFILLNRLFLRCTAFSELHKYYLLVFEFVFYYFFYFRVNYRKIYHSTKMNLKDQSKVSNK